MKQSASLSITLFKDQVNLSLFLPSSFVPFTRKEYILGILLLFHATNQSFDLGAKHRAQDHIPGVEFLGSD
jgi:hypothetical protein